ncbi:dihydroxy-acid dehydratase [Cladophialophora immunda]|uniref:Dihydroxy-acid dehydratase n=1 Tax=Cladophialophora immunda TaxID=569365 RepID=A0A0D1Z653_9EURO|nr:dihydroxy-acid dehydratase [Cladophialophora immunda]KIW23041.1 dihydroxy-acid dehydratase [Cladophialophora immunda]
MTESCGKGCNQPCREQNDTPDIEDFRTEIKSLKQRNEELARKLSDLAYAGSTSSSRTLRSENWFSNDREPALSTLYADRYLNFGLTTEELMSKKPVIGIAQSGSDLSPCNRYHVQTAKRMREGIIAAGAIPLEFSTHPIQESSRRPTATLDRNLAYLVLVEILHSYPLDGVVLLTGCDKTTPACLMAAATVNIPAICLNVGPMLNGRRNRDLIGTGTILWRARELKAEGTIDDTEFFDMVTSGTPSAGHCNTMGTASSMNALAEALGMALPGSAAIPAVYRERLQCAYKTGQQIVEMVHSNRRPSDIMTREAFENAIVVNSAIGGSSNCPIHLIAIARHMGITLDLDDWDRLGYRIPLLVNVQPAGEMLCEEYHHAGGLPAVMAELLAAGKLHAKALSCTGRTIGDIVKGKFSWDRKTIRPYGEPLKKNAGFLHLKGTLFDSAIMKTSVISEEFEAKFLWNASQPGKFAAFECKARVFDGPEDYNEHLDDNVPMDDRTVLVMRGAGPIGYPGAPEVVNMHAPGRLLKAGVRSLPCIGDGRQSGTSGSPSILHASPEAAAGGNLAILRTGDTIRIDLESRRVDLLLSDEEIRSRRATVAGKMEELTAPSQTPWQDIFRREVGQLSDGMALKNAVNYQRIADHFAVPRHNH